MINAEFSKSMEKTNGQKDSVIFSRTHNGESGLKKIERADIDAGETGENSVNSN